jgi:hypothetical protein
MEQQLNEVFEVCGRFLYQEQTMPVLQNVFEALNEFMRFTRTRVGQGCFSKKARQMMTPKLKSYKEQLEKVLDNPSEAVEPVFCLHELLLGVRLLSDDDDYVSLFQEDVASVMFKKRKHPFNGDCCADEDCFCDDNNEF